MIKKILFGSLMTAGLVFLTAGCSTTLSGTAARPDTATGSDTIRIGVRQDIRRWAYYDEDSEIFSGAEADYARAVGRELGYSQVELVPVTPENLKRSITEGEVDCLVSKCTIMDTSEEDYEFSPAYYEDQGSFMVEDSSRIRNIKGLVGKKIGIISGSDVKDRILKKLKGMNLITEEDSKGTRIVEEDSFEGLSDSLESGDIDAFAGDGCILRAWQDEERTILKDTYQDKEYGIAVIKDTPLSEEIGQAVRRLEEKDTMETIVKRWYEGEE